MFYGFKLSILVGLQFSPMWKMVPKTEDLNPWGERVLGMPWLLKSQRTQVSAYKPTPCWERFYSGILPKRDFVLTNCWKWKIPIGPFFLSFLFCVVKMGAESLKFSMASSPLLFCNYIAQQKNIFPFHLL